MLEHQAAVHRDDLKPQFRFKVVKRIEMRGNVLNKKGMFNRCKLTRMVVDTEWDQKVWEEAWEPRAEETVTEDSLRETGKAKRGSKEGGAAKIAKREEHGVIWGEESREEDSPKR